MELYLIRHALSLWQENISSSKDSTLSRMGQNQLQFLRGHISKLISSTSKSSYKIISSPLKRSVQTVQALQENYVIADELQEPLFHVASKLPNIDNISLYRKHNIEDEEYKEFKKTITSKLNDIIQNTEYQNVFIFTHGGVIKTILRIIHDNDGIDYIINNCSVTKISWYRSRWTINYINDTSFLPQQYIT